MFSLPLFFLINILFISNNTIAQTATVVTNKSDYSPGQYVIVTGSNWQPGQIIALTFTEAPVIHPSVTINTTADASGNIYNNKYLIDDHHIGQTITLVATGQNPFLTATTTFTDGFNTFDFKQAENPNHSTNPITWTGGNLGTSNSEYYEGMGVPQRLFILNVDSRASTQHTLLIKHLANKGPKHAYDFMMSWDQAVQTAGAIANGPLRNELQNLISQICTGAISADAGTACATLTSSLLPISKIAVLSLPDNMGDPGFGNIPVAGHQQVFDNIKCFENKYGDRSGQC